MGYVAEIVAAYTELTAGEAYLGTRADWTDLRRLADLVGLPAAAVRRRPGLGPRRGRQGRRPADRRPARGCRHRPARPAGRADLRGRRGHAAALRLGGLTATWVPVARKVPRAHACASSATRASAPATTCSSCSENPRGRPCGDAARRGGRLGPRRTAGRCWPDVLCRCAARPATARSASRGGGPRGRARHRAGRVRPRPRRDPTSDVAVLRRLRVLATAARHGGSASCFGPRRRRRERPRHERPVLPPGRRRGRGRRDADPRRDPGDAVARPDGRHRRLGVQPLRRPARRGTHADQLGGHARHPDEGLAARVRRPRRRSRPCPLRKGRSRRTSSTGGCSRATTSSPRRPPARRRASCGSSPRRRRPPRASR